MPIKLSVEIAGFPIAGTFTISRGSRTEATVVVVTLVDGHAFGRGECVPYARYGETADSVVAALTELTQEIASGLDRHALQTRLPAGAARNALDCAFWDLEAKRSGKRVHELAGLPVPRDLLTAYTISLGSPEVMAVAARDAAARPLLKLKLGGEGDPERLAAVRAAAPASELIVDANEAWRPDQLVGHLQACAAAGVTLVEQPLPTGNDDALALVPHPVPVCADESVHDRASLGSLRGKYDAINIKLDKAGGLTEALALAQEAERLDFRIMVGCMVSTSLAIAPAVLVAQRAQVVDLDGPLLLARDRPDGITYSGSVLHPPAAALWG
ncbi:MAG: L-Ala-D/L-Glu epimerase [Variibacter sp.]|jgi:L-alanine-DL-glutamate epimerase-like enolase superfamily enzyme|nr:L-Ala-D/L-Glu epimerase [Variibacter sp.]